MNRSDILIAMTTLFDAVEFKKQIKAVDLALQAARKRQSPRTGFVHYFSTDETALDTIPLFENFCFAMALLRQKSAELVLEGKELLDRLLAFQSPNGNFPVYLHDYPRTWDKLMPLKIAPIFVQILRHFSSILNAEIRQKIEAARSRALQSIDAQTLAPLWKHRYSRLLNQNSCFTPSTPEEWFETLLSDQLLVEGPLKTAIPFHKELQVFIGPHTSQEKGEPRPAVVEWLCAESSGYSERLLREHPHQMYAALLFPIENHFEDLSPLIFLPQLQGSSLLWGGSKLHSLSIPSGRVSGQTIFFDLDHEASIERDDLFEALVFCDLSSETDIFVDGKQGTVFHLGQTIRIQTPKLQIELIFRLVEGAGDFCGQISRANRPSQRANQKALLYEVFDWQIGLRTLRRSFPCKIALELKF